jgi:hypothetical protein
VQVKKQLAVANRRRRRTGRMCELYDAPRKQRHASIDHRRFSDGPL